MKADTLIRKNEKIVARKIGGEYILVPVQDNIADMKAVYVMNDTAAFIWDNIDNGKTIGELADIMAAEYEADRKLIMEDLLELLGDMLKNNIILI